VLAGGVVRQPQATSGLHHVCAGRPGDREHAHVGRYVKVLRAQGFLRDALTVTYGRPHHLDHGRCALEKGRPVGVVRGGVHTRVQLADGAHHCVGLTQGGHDITHIAKERRVGAHDEHSAPLQDPAVGVEQVRGAMQGGDRLAGARPALHNEYTVQAGTDYAVLFGLDRGDDVSHAAGAFAVQGGQESGLADASAPLAVGEPLHVEVLVVDPDHPAATHTQVPAPNHVRWGPGGGGVEGACGRSAPVHEDGLVFGVAQPDPTHVPNLGVLLLGVGDVDPPDAQAFLDRAELGAPTGILVGAGLTFHDPGIADLLLQVGGRELTFGMCAQFVESCIHCVDPALLIARYDLLE